MSEQTFATILMAGCVKPTFDDAGVTSLKLVLFLYILFQEMPARVLKECLCCIFLLLSRLLPGMKVLTSTHSE